MAGFGPSADGVLTPGGSISNLLAVLIARDNAAAALGIDVRRNGMSGLEKPVVFCSELAHFSVQRACAALGLGEDAAITVPADGDFRMRLDILADELAKPGRTPLAVIATAGTTDYGSIDPIAEIATLARQHAAWVHVDAAYGFGALFSDRLAPLLAELPAADSVTLDLHKIGWQPAATSMLLVADRERFASLGRSVEYLNPADDIDSGLDGLLGRSLQTTRRPDAVKVATTLTAYGRAGLGRMLDTCHELAHAAAARVVADSNLELLAPVTLTTVLFRVAGQGLAASELTGSQLDAVQGEVRRRLLTSGRVLIGRTRIPARGGRPAVVALKLTLLNPNATATDIEELLDQVVACGHDVLPREGAA
jgi:L-2,4-diaminobutyrate decarboxylase